MDKQFDNLTWADLAIINDELKTVREHDIKLLKYMDLQTVCSQLKVRGGQEHNKGTDDQETVDHTPGHGKVQQDFRDVRDCINKKGAPVPF